MKGYCKHIISAGKIITVIGLIMLLIVFVTKSVPADSKDYPYMIKVNRAQNAITIYGKDSAGKYKVPIRAMVCSVGRSGAETVLGTFKTKSRYRWKALMGNVWGQYSTRIVGGILFHSVYYYENNNPATLANKEYNKLGTAASHGCIRLTVEDAKWIYDNCPVGTTVMIYDDKKSPGPLGKPEAIKLPASVRWDPTDPHKKNPYYEKTPTITGARSHTVEWGSKIDLLKGIKAKSCVGLDITKNIKILGEVDTFKPGKHKITYTVTDALGRTYTKKITVTVKENNIDILFMGVSDRIIAPSEDITKDLAMSGVKIFMDGKLLKNKEVEVTISEVSKEKYLITYDVYCGKVILDSASALFLVDSEAPELLGVSDRDLEKGTVVDESFALQGVEISDNYSELDLEDIQVTIEAVAEKAEDTKGTEKTEGLEKTEETEETVIAYYNVTYEACDEVGNIIRKTVLFNY